MIARTWRGWTSAGDADRYLEYLEATGLKAYRTTPGNRGAMVLRRAVEERVEFLIISFWDSVESIRRFAGDDLERAVFYPEDDDLLTDRDLRVSHFDLVYRSQ